MSKMTPVFDNKFLGWDKSKFTGEKKIGESDVEGAVKKHGKKLGVMSEKFSSPAKRSVPDQIFTFRYGLIAFIEMKAPGKPASPAQLEDHRKRRERGCFVFLVDDIEVGCQLITMLEYLDRVTQVRSTQLPVDRR